MRYFFNSTESTEKVKVHLEIALAISKPLACNMHTGKNILILHIT